MEDYINQFIFEGEYYDGKRKGFGKLIDIRTGDIYEGEWKEDMKEGPGKLTSKKNKFVIDGIWKNDELVTTLNLNVNNTQQ